MGGVAGRDMVVNVCLKWSVSEVGRGNLEYYYPVLLVQASGLLALSGESICSNFNFPAHFPMKTHTYI